jgi:DNA-binding protein Fis
MQRFASLFATVAAIAGMVAAYLFLQLRAEQLRSARLQERIAQLDSAQVATVAATAPAATGMHPADAVPLEGSAGEGAGRVQPARPQATTPSTAISFRALMADPEYRKAQLAQMRVQIRQAYPDLGKALGLTSAESEAFFDMLGRHMEEQMTRSFEPASSPEAREEQRRAVNAQQQASQAEIEQLLGPTRNEQWKDYLATLEGRQRVVQLRTMLANTEHPLTAQQEAPLLDTVLAESRRRRQQVASMSAQPDPQAQLDYQERILKETAESHDRVTEGARAYLNAPQLELLRSSLDQQLAIQRAVLRARRAQRESQGEAGTLADSGLVMGAAEGGGTAVVIAQ